MMAALFANLTDVAVNPQNQALVGGGVTAVLAGVVVWLARSYREDMAKRAEMAAKAHEQMLAEFKAALAEQRKDFRDELSAQRIYFRDELSQINNAVDSLTNSVQKLATEISEMKTPSSHHDRG